LARLYVPYEYMLNGYRNDAVSCVPVIPNVTKGWHDQNIRSHFEQIAELAKRSGIMIGNLGWIEPFAKAGIPVYGDYGLNLYNSMDFFVARELGIKEAVISHEAVTEDIIKMNFYEVIPEVVIAGRIPLMVSEHSFAEDLELDKREKGNYKFYLKDRKGEAYPFYWDDKSGKSTIFSYRLRNNWEDAEIFKSYGLKSFRIYGE
jgi:collagenase-like PrtC family protease